MKSNRPLILFIGLVSLANFCSAQISSMNIKETNLPNVDQYWTSDSLLQIDTQLLKGTWTMDSLGVKISHWQNDTSIIFLDSNVVQMSLNFSKDKIIRRTRSNAPFADYHYSNFEGKWKILESESTMVKYDLLVKYGKRFGRNFKKVSLDITYLDENRLVIEDVVYDLNLMLISVHTYFLTKTDDRAD